MTKKLTLAVALLMIFSITSFAQWTNVGGTWAFTDTNPDTVRGQVHGIAVDPDGKIWVQVWAAQTVEVAPGDTVVGVYAIRVFNADGTFADIDPIVQITTGGGFVVDTLYASVVSNPRGMRTDNNGNILSVWGSGNMYRINYQTGEGMNKEPLALGTSPTAPAVDGDGRIFVAPVVPGNPIKIYNSDLTFAGNAVDETAGFARTVMVSHDGNTVYHCGYTNGYVTVYSRPNAFSGYDSVGTILDGFDVESAGWNPKSDLFWASAGSYNDQAEGYTNGTYYGYDIANGIIVDSLSWQFNEPANPAERNRGIDFSPDGNTAYYVIFGTGGFPIVQKSVQDLTPVNITLNVDMNVQIAEGKFVPGSGTINAAGTFNGWSTSASPMTDSDGDGIYSVVIPNQEPGTRLFFKFVMNGQWEENLNPSPYDNNNRSHVVTAGNTSYTKFYNDDLGSGVEVQFNFSIDMEVEIKKGTFNSASDVLTASGSVVQDPTKTFSINLTPSAGNANVFEGSVGIKVFEGDVLTNTVSFGSTSETEASQRTATSTIITAGSTTIARGFNGLRIADVTEQEVTLTFQVDMRGAVNDVTKAPFDAIENVVLAGKAAPLGWPTPGWPDSDQSLVKFLNDSGQDGDLFANDTLWSTTVVFPAYTDMRFEYKYGANWGLASNGGSNDNEASTGVLHSMTLNKDIQSALVVDEWANMSPADLDSVVSDVEELPLPIPTLYTLDQNYPNPFNPTTNIRFAVPVADKVTLKIYDVLGQEVATLLNEFKKAGTYEVSFDASRLSSGMYVYTITTGKFVASKKMLLIK